MYYNMCVYVYMSYVIIYIYHPNPQGHKSVASQSLNLHLGTSAHEFGSQCLVKTFIFRFNYCIKVVLFYPLCNNIIVFFLPFFTTQPAFNFDLEAQLHCLSQPSQLAVQLRQHIARAGPIQSHGGFGDG